MKTCEDIKIDNLRHQFEHFNPFRYSQRPRAASSSSMLQDVPSPMSLQSLQVPGSTRLYHQQHPYHQLPGASLSLQTLNLNNKSNSSNLIASPQIPTGPSPATNGCVYLRPEQNIPEVFANPGTVFKPIDEIDNASDVNDNDGNIISDVTTGAISRDDIVVTMRSVNV